MGTYGFVLILFGHLINYPTKYENCLVKLGQSIIFWDYRFLSKNLLRFMEKKCFALQIQYNLEA